MIACLGWGSLIWDPRELPIRRKWFEDGPLVPVEFSRQSRDGRLTLVVFKDATPIRVLWALMSKSDLDWAQDALGKREGIPQKRRKDLIGTWSVNQTSPHSILGLSEWAGCRGITGVVWTALEPCFNNENRTPSADEVVTYLCKLEGPTRNLAERYVRCTPRQVDTPYRRRIEASLGWTPWDC